MPLFSDVLQAEYNKGVRLIFRSIGLILSGNLAGAVIGMIRTLLVSRLISLEDYGIASIFVLAVSLIEMMSAMGFQQQMIQSKDGNDPRFQSALQCFAVIRGFVNGLILILLAQPIASFFSIPEVAWAFQVVALIPIMSGFNHFDVGRLKRQMNYVPATIVSVLPSIGSLASVFPFYWLFGDYRTLLFAILLQVLIMLLTTHFLAKRKYCLVFDRAIISRSLRFGWPLMVSSLMLYTIFNGERIIIGRELNLETLAVFSMALSLALTPTLVISGSTMSFFLPQLSGAIHKPAYPALAVTAFQSHLTLGNLVLVGIALVGGPFLHIVLGQKYADAIPLLTWLGVVQTIRIYKSGCSAISISGGFTKNQIMINIARVLLLPLAWFLIARGGDLMTLIWIAMGGEIVGLIIGMLWTRRQKLLPLRPLLVSLSVSMVLLIVACVHAHLQTSWSPDWRTSIVLILLLILSVCFMPELRTYLRRRTITAYQEET